MSAAFDRLIRDLCRQIDERDALIAAAKATIASLEREVKARISEQERQANARGNRPDGISLGTREVDDITPRRAMDTDDVAERAPMPPYPTPPQTEKSFRWR